MKILKDGKEVKNAKVIYDGNGNAVNVQQDGVMYDIKAFELVEGDTKVVKKDSQNKQSKKVVDEPKTVKTSQANDSVMTTEDLKRK